MCYARGRITVNCASATARAGRGRGLHDVPCLIPNTQPSLGPTANLHVLADVPGMLTRPAGHEAKAEARKSEAEVQNFFRGRGHNV